MKSILKRFFVVALMIMLLGLTSVTSASTTGALVLSKTSETYEPGQEFTVSLSVSNFNATSEEMTFRGKVVWDTTKLEIISAKAAEGWSSMNTDGRFNKTTGKFNIDNDNGIEANSKVFDLTFKAKQNVEGDAKISIEDIDMYEGDFSAVSTTVKIAKPEQKPDVTPNEPEVSEPSQNEPSEVPPVNGDEPVVSPSNGESHNSPSEVTPNSPEETTGTPKADTTARPGVLPQTGVNYFLWTGAVICVIAAVAIVVFYQRAKNVARRQK